jgi:hypothetical protein
VKRALILHKKADLATLPGFYVGKVVESGENGFSLVLVLHKGIFIFSCEFTSKSSDLTRENNINLNYNPSFFKTVQYV